MSRFLAHWFIVAVALWLTARIVPGVAVSSVGALVVGALVLGLVNALIRPVLVILTLPITILTLGLFYVIVNAVAFGLAAAVVPGFSIQSFGSAILGAFLVGLISWLIGVIVSR